MRDTDESLLLSFALQRDEGAFRQLTERYLGLIFHTALRRTGNRQMAEEVSQNVLCAVSRKAAALARKPDLLPSWLHRATLFESFKAMRAEQSQQNRRKDIPLERMTNADPAWVEALPYLDQALDKLPDTDRRVLFQHYFENQAFPVIARKLGKSTAAVQKQSQRALGKLARLLRARGVTLSATVVATGLGSELAKAAPASLIHGAAATAFAGSSAYSTQHLTLMFAMKSKAVISAAIVICATPLLLQQMAISRAEDRIHELTSVRPSAASLTRGPADKMPGMPDRGLSRSRDIFVLMDECDAAQRNRGLPYQRFRQKLAMFDEKTLESLIRKCVTINAHRERRNNLLKHLAQSLSGKDPGRAARFLFEAIPDGPYLAFQLRNCNYRTSLALWAQQDPDAALGWFREIGKSPKFTKLRTSPPDLQEVLWEPILNALILNRHPELRSFILDVPAQKRSRLILEGIQQAGTYGRMTVYDRSGVGTFDILPGYIPLIREWLGEDSGNTALDNARRAIKASLGEEDARKTAFQTIVSLMDRFPGGDMSNVRNFYAKAGMSPDEEKAMGVMIATRRLSLGHQPNQMHMLEAAVRELDRWLAEQFGDRAAEIKSEADAAALQEEANKAQWVVKRLKQDLNVSDIEIARDLRDNNLRSQLSEALEIAGRIKDVELRKSVIESLHQQANPNPKP